jgi:ABC-2 type transport system permease protein
VTDTHSARPPLRRTLGSLLRADLTVIGRGWRSQAQNIGLPLFLLGTSWLQLDGRPHNTDAAVMAVGFAMTVGPLATGIFGYSLGVARDREIGVFQRLRVTPAPTWTIMVSRLLAQVLVNIVGVVVVAAVGAVAFKFQVGVVSYLLLIPTAIIVGAVFLSIGQALVGLLASAAQINVVGRGVLVALLLLGVLGRSGGLGESIKSVARWSPVGPAEDLFHTVLADAGWTTADTGALLACLGYVLVFGVLGIRYFRWDSR